MGLKRNLHGISKAGVMEQSFIFNPNFSVGPSAIAVYKCCIPASWSWCGQQPGPQLYWASSCSSKFSFIIVVFCLFLTVLGLRCSLGCPLVVVLGLPMAVASLLWNMGSGVFGLQSTGSVVVVHSLAAPHHVRSSQIRGQTMSPALESRFFTMEA